MSSERDDCRGISKYCALLYRMLAFAGCEVASRSKGEDSNYYLDSTHRIYHDTYMIHE